MATEKPYRRWQNTKNIVYFASFLISTITIIFLILQFNYFYWLKHCWFDVFGSKRLFFSKKIESIRRENASNFTNDFLYNNLNKKNFANLFLKLVQNILFLFWSSLYYIFYLFFSNCYFDLNKKILKCGSPKVKHHSQLKFMTTFLTTMSSIFKSLTWRGEKKWF